MTRQVRLTAEQYDEWHAKIQAQKKVRGKVTGLAVGGVSSVVGKPAPSPHFPYKSKLEKQYSQHLDLLVKAGEIKRWWYEPFSIWLPGKVRYKPDFLIQYPLGMERSMEIIEIKGWSRNQRDGITRYKIAASLFPCFTWRLVRMSKSGGWDGGYL